MIEWGYAYADLMGMSDIEFQYQYKIAESRRAARREMERQAWHAAGR